tara:strand:+ start:1049 stop:1276 length:228 start_codon:yes stop_codon:yes gene_type:complete
MKIRKAVGYIIQEQRELEVDFILDKTQISEIVNSFFDKMEYDERRRWIFDNVPEPNAVLVDDEKEGEQPPFSPLS